MGGNLSSRILLDNNVGLFSLGIHGANIDDFHCMKILAARSAFMFIS